MCGYLVEYGIILISPENMLWLLIISTELHSAVGSGSDRSRMTRSRITSLNPSLHHIALGETDHEIISMVILPLLMTQVVIVVKVCAQGLLNCLED